MIEKTMIWITKYALTRGIFQANVDTMACCGTSFVCGWEDSKGKWKEEFIHPGEFETTMYNAIQGGERIRRKALESAIEKVKKLENLKIKVISVEYSSI